MDMFIIHVNHRRDRAPLLEGCIRVGVMKVFSVKLGLAGLLCFGSAGVWTETVVRSQKRSDPPGWIIDRALPLGPQRLAWFEIGLVLVAVVLGIIKIARRLVARWTQQGETREEALANIQEAAELYVEDCIDAGDPVPAETGHEFIELTLGR